MCIYWENLSNESPYILYLLLPDKKEETYVFAFETFLSHLRHSGNDFKEDVKFICDFEIAQISAIKKIFIKNSNSL